MAVNGEAVFGSRPWHVYGEGPTRLQVGMQNEGAFKGFTPQDVRFTVNRGALYAFFLAAPDAPPTIASLGLGNWNGAIERVTLLGHGHIDNRRDERGLWLDLPRGLGTVPVVKIDGRGIAPA